MSSSSLRPRCEVVRTRETELARVGVCCHRCMEVVMRQRRSHANMNAFAFVLVWPSVYPCCEVGKDEGDGDGKGMSSSSRRPRPHRSRVGV